MNNERISGEDNLDKGENSKFFLKIEFGIILLDENENKNIPTISIFS
jgi:hypothetical protein